MVASADSCHMGMQSSIARSLGEDQEVFVFFLNIYLFIFVSAGSSLLHAGFL